VICCFSFIRLLSVGPKNVTAGNFFSHRRKVVLKIPARPSTLDFLHGSTLPSSDMTSIDSIAINKMQQELEMDFVERENHLLQQLAECKEKFVFLSRYHPPNSKLHCVTHHQVARRSEIACRCRISIRKITS